MMDKQREAFEKLFDYKNLDDRQKLIVDGSCYKTFCEGWQAAQAQADKMEFARKVADRVLDTAYNAIHDSEEYLCNYDLPSVDVNSIIAKVEQEQ